MAENKALKEFIAESEELADSIEKKLFELSDLCQAGQESPDLINAIFRDFHSLKGISGMFGFSNLSNLAHQLENFLDRLRLGKIDLSNQVLEIMMGGKNLMAAIIGEISQTGLDSTPVDDFLVQISDAVKKPQQAEHHAAASSTSLNSLKSVLTEYEEHRLHDNIKKGRKIFSLRFMFTIDEFDERLNEITGMLKNAGEVISTLPKPSDKPGHIIFSIVYATDRNPDDLPVKTAFSYVLEELTGEEEAVPAEHKGKDATAVEAAVPDGPLKSVSNTVRVDISKLDFLMNIVGELVTQKAELVQIIDRVRPFINNEEIIMSLNKVSNTLGKKVNELQQSVMAVRMVPLNLLFEKLERNVKKIAHALQKEIRTSISGGDTEIDKYIAEELADPLMHIIRNAIDHGIETPEERAALGKPEHGQIELLAYQKGNYVYIEVKDDGRGIDTQQIRQKLISSGKLNPEQEASEDFLTQTIFSAGFSIKENATELSGRGVGLDVVKSNLARMRGIVDVKTQLGKGTSFILTLPLTLIIIQAIVIRTSGKVLAIPLSSIDEILEISTNDVIKISGEDAINLRNVPLPVFYLENFFGFSSGGATNYRFLIVLKVGERRACLMVDDIAGQGDIVIKSLGRYIKVRGIAGATQIGNGQTILVLDPSGLMEGLANA